MSGVWRDRAVLVTGATGVVGSWLVKRLIRERARVVALVRDADPRSELLRSGDIDAVSVVNGPLEDVRVLERAVNEHEIEVVFHLGAQALVGAAQRSPLPTFEANIRGTYNLLEVCRVHAGLVRAVVVASSDKAYGTQPALPYREEMPLEGRFPYEVSKSCADLIATSYHHAYALPVGIARCGNIYGGGDLNWSRIVPGTIRSLLEGRRPIVRSDGTYRRDYVYVEDAVDAYLTLAAALAAGRHHGEAFNFSTEEPSTVLEVVDVLRDLLGARHLEPEILGTATGEIPHQHLSAEKARRLLGWRARFDLEAGLRRTIAAYRDLLEGARIAA